MIEESFESIMGDNILGKEEINMAVMAKPQKQSFVVDHSGAQKFRDEKMSKEDWNEIVAHAKEFKKNNLRNSRNG